MQRIPEPELMDSEAQAKAYAEADFVAPHSMFVRLFGEMVGEPCGNVLDLGCGPADVTCRFASAFPDCQIDGVDGAEAMLRYGRQAVEAAGLAPRVRLLQGYLPGATLPRERYDVIISNSLLHHLADPLVLWRTVKNYLTDDGQVFVMDLMRPGSREEVAQLVQLYADNEPEILRQDFHRSLLAAYPPDEIVRQLDDAKLQGLVLKVVSDRHLVVTGRNSHD